MPRNALMAFCTFYQHFQKGRFTDPKLSHCDHSPIDPFDFVSRSTSVLTRLRFVRKSDLASKPEAVSMPDKFDLVLYPNSMFLMSLTGNRCYTHEIIPSCLPVAILPTRLGYILRCSKTVGMHVHGVAHIIVDKEEKEIKQPTDAAMKEIKGLYFAENATSSVITYPSLICSLNSGDYKKPVL